MADTANVTSAKPKTGGGVMWGATTATLPTTYNGTTTGFTDLGHISEDGVTESTTIESEEKKSWGGVVVDVLNKSKVKQFKMTFLESKNSEVLKLIYGDSNVTTASSSISVKEDAKDMGRHAFIIDMLTKDNKVRRKVIPNATVSNIGDIKYVGSDDIMYEVTLSAMVDASGFFQYDYIES